jgi:hypothetical protein
MSASVTFRGILDTAFDNFLCLRGFARIGDLADASVSDESYQRPLIEQNKDELKTYLEMGESKFFPEVILSTHFDAEGSSDKVREFLLRQATKPQALKIDSEKFKFKLSSRYYAAESGDMRARDKLIDAAMTIDAQLTKFSRIDGNHRLSISLSPYTRDLKVPFCLVLFPDSRKATQFSRTLFHTINFKMRPLAQEQNLKLILDETVHNLNLFPPEVLNKPPFGLGYEKARAALKAIHFEALPALRHVLIDKTNELLEEHYRTLALGLSQKVGTGITSATKWGTAFAEALARTHAIYQSHQGLRGSKNKGLLEALIILSWTNEQKANTKRSRFVDWVTRNSLYAIGEVQAQGILDVFEKLEAAKSKQIFVAMPFRSETEATWHAILDAVTDFRKTSGLEIKDPIRIDKHDHSRSYKITDEIFKLIDESGLLIADLTYGNPNVYHEIGFSLGIKHSRLEDFKTNMLLIWHEERKLADDEDTIKREKNDVRFDLKDWSHIRFKDTNSLRNQLAAALTESFKL